MSLGATPHCTTPVSGVRGTQLMWLAVLGAVAALILLAGLSGLGPHGGPARAGGSGTARPLSAQARTHLTQAPLGLALAPHTHRWTCVGTGHEPTRLM